MEWWLYWLTGSSHQKLWRVKGTGLCLFVVRTLEFGVWVSLLSFPGGSEGKEAVSHAGDWDSVAGSGRVPGEGNGNPLQSSCVENSTDRGTWRATVHGSQRVRHEWGTNTYLLGFDDLNFGHLKQPCWLSFVHTTHLEAYLCSHIGFPGSGSDLSLLLVKMGAWQHPAFVVLCRCSAWWLPGGGCVWFS